MIGETMVLTADEMAATVIDGLLAKGKILPSRPYNIAFSVVDGKVVCMVTALPMHETPPESWDQAQHGYDN